MIDPISEEDKAKLRAVGREDLIEINELIRAGRAGITQMGTLVDASKHKVVHHLDTDGKPIVKAETEDAPKRRTRKRTNKKAE